MGVEDGLPISTAEQFERWLAVHGKTERELWAIIYKKASGKQTVTFNNLLEVAITRGWIDVQDKGLDAERYGIRFMPRKPGSNWSATNRTLVKRLISEERMHPEGNAVLPNDL